MTKTPETKLIFGPQPKFELPEHTGGDGWTILHGDCLSLMRQMQDGVFDAIITEIIIPSLIQRNGIIKKYALAV